MICPAWPRSIIELTDLTSLHSNLRCVRRELASLQSAYQTERLEGDKVRQLLAYEETRRCNLEESLDQAHKHAKDQQRDVQNKVPVSIDRNTHHLICAVHEAVIRLLAAVPIACSILQRPFTNRRLRQMLLMTCSCPAGCSAIDTRHKC